MAVVEMEERMMEVTEHGVGPTSGSAENLPGGSLT